MKSSVRHETIQSSRDLVFHGVLRSAEFFDPTGLNPIVTSRQANRSSKRVSFGEGFFRGGGSQILDLSENHSPSPQMAA